MSLYSDGQDIQYETKLYQWTGLPGKIVPLHDDLVEQKWPQRWIFVTKVASACLHLDRKEGLPSCCNSNTRDLS